MIKTKRRIILVILVSTIFMAVIGAGKALIVEDPSIAANAIVVIGGDHKPERMQPSVALFNQGQAPIVIISAGTLVLEGLETVPEAEVMRRQAIALGLPEYVMIIEDQSQTTFENAELTRELLENRQIKSIILVTSAYHSRRARRIFRDEMGAFIQLAVHPAAPINPPLLWMFYSDERQVVQYEYRNWVLYWLNILVNQP